MENPAPHIFAVFSPPSPSPANNNTKKRESKDKQTKQQTCNSCFVCASQQPPTSASVSISTRGARCWPWAWAPPAGSSAGRAGRSAPSARSSPSAQSQAPFATGRTAGDLAEGASPKALRRGALRKPRALEMEVSRNFQKIQVLTG